MKFSGFLASSDINQDVEQFRSLEPEKLFEAWMETKKTTKKAASAKKTAKKSDETPKKTTRKKKTEAAE